MATIREEMFKSAALGVLQSLLDSRELTLEQLDKACGWDTGELGSRLWDQEAFSVEDLCELILAAKRISTEGGWTEDPPLAHFDVLFQTVGFRDGTLLTKVPQVDKVPQVFKENPEDAWSGRLLKLIARYLLVEVADGRYPAQKLATELRRYAEITEKLDEKDS